MKVAVMTTSDKKTKRTWTGIVVSDKMDKTIVVKVTRTYMNPLVHKVVKSTKKYKVHDEKNEAKPGDIVEFYEGRPASKTKCMYLSRVINDQTVA